MQKRHINAKMPNDLIKKRDDVKMAISVWFIVK